MPEIHPDLSDTSRCVSVHWSLPAQCVMPRTHRANWHETWHPQTGNRIRYRRSCGTYATDELSDGEWHDLALPAPGDICVAPHSSKPGIFCQEPGDHQWMHRAIVDGCTHTWNLLNRGMTPGQIQQDMADFRRLADEQAAEIELLHARLEAVEQFVDRDQDGICCSHAQAQLRRILTAVPVQGA